MDVLVKMLVGSLKGRMIVEPKETADQLVSDGLAIFPNEGEYVTREMKPQKRRGRPPKKVEVEEDPATDGD